MSVQRLVVFGVAVAVSVAGVATWAQGSGGVARVPTAVPQAAGTIAGVVEDSQGGVIPGATVELISDTRGLRGMQAVTNTSGEFVIANIAPDTYTVQVSMPGFRTLRRPGVRVSGGDRIVVPSMVLEVAQVSRFTRPGEAVGPIIAGQDIGFQPVYSANTPAGTVAGRWMVRVNGRWLEASTPFRTVPAR